MIDASDSSWSQTSSHRVLVLVVPAAGVREGPSTSWSGDRTRVKCVPAATGTTAFVSSPNLVCVDLMVSRWPQVHADGLCWYLGGTRECGVCVEQV